MTEFDYNSSFEFLAARFYRESGYMAPGKDVAPEMAYSEVEDKTRHELWDAFIGERKREAWTLWHQKYGYLQEGSNGD